MNETQNFEKQNSQPEPTSTGAINTQKVTPALFPARNASHHSRHSKHSSPIQHSRHVARHARKELKIFGIHHKILPLVTAIAVLVLSFAGLGTAIALVRKNVNLEIDGKTHSVVSWESSVKAVLEENGVILGKRDYVQPSLEATLASGDTISVRSARQIGYTVDEQKHEVWTTESSVQDAIKAMGLVDKTVQLDYTQGKTRNGEELPLISKDGQILLLHDGTQTQLKIGSKDTVQSALDKAKLNPDDNDRVTTIFTKGALPQISLVRVETQQVTHLEPIDFAEEKTVDPQKYKDEKIETRKGVKGEKTVTRRVTTEDGKEVKSEVLREETTKQPVSRQITVGSKDRPVQAASSEAYSVPADVWGSLARCESGGNPSVVSSNGLYHGLYQFSVSTWRSVGGSGLPSQASAQEQTMRAQMLQARSGWGQWPACSRRLGLR